MTENVVVKEVVDIASVKAKNKTGRSGPVYRNILVRELYNHVLELSMQRRQLWVRIGFGVLPLMTLIPMAMPQWKWALWIGAILLVMPFVFLWDYVFHIRHIQEMKKVQHSILIVEDDFEKLYAITRPEKSDYVAPYILFFVCCIGVIGFNLALGVYKEHYDDSVIANALVKSPDKMDVKTIDVKTTIRPAKISD